jgi:allantoin racemase
MTHPDGMRILWQSSAALDRFPFYAEAIRDHARERCAAGTAIEVRGVPDLFPDTGALHYKAFDFLNNRALLDSALRAAHEGFDAVAVGCFLDPVLDELKELLDIPVVGLAETAMHMACMLGRRFAILSHTAAFNIKFHEDLIAKYGLGKHAGPLISFELPFEELEAGLRGNPAPCLERIRQAGRQAVAQGAEVILLGCGLMNLAGIRNGLTEIDGAPVLDISGALLKTAEAMVVLRRTSGLRVSRKGYFARPADDMIDAVARAHGLGVR